jgi:hypothetical protein
VTGFVFLLTDGTGHSATPRQGSYVKERDGRSADLLSGLDYPVTAVCARCGGTIRLAHHLQWEWRHAPVVATAAGGVS